ncbi:baseplate wedge subunit [Synechococcus phage S-CREM1]|nr:baseplate wedge subunit [Synechococcus phage S-CREM1]
MADSDDIFRVTPRSFRDVGTNFSKNPLTNDVISLKDESAVTQSIKNLIMTKFGEKLMDPSIGSDVYNMLFEPLDAFSALDLKDRILNTIRNFEPRVDVLDVLVTATEDDDSAIVVTLTYRIIGEPQIINNKFLLERPVS